MWVSALGAATEKGSEIAETTTTLLGRRGRLIVRRQPKAAGDTIGMNRARTRVRGPNRWK